MASFKFVFGCLVGAVQCGFCWVVLLLEGLFFGLVCFGWLCFLAGLGCFRCYGDILFVVMCGDFRYLLMVAFVFSCGLCVARLLLLG